VCVLARNKKSIDTHTVLRERGRIYRLFDELVIRNDLCRFVLDLPVAGLIGSLDTQHRAAASPSGVTVGGHESDEKLRTLMRYLNARVAPVRKGAAFLVCGRYGVRATVVDHLEVAGKSEGYRPAKPGAKSTTRHLVIQSVSNVKAKDLWGALYRRTSTSRCRKTDYDHWSRCTQDGLTMEARRSDP